MDKLKPAAKVPTPASRKKLIRLSREDADRLILTAHDCRGRAYAPYSDYQVGAAVLTGEGRIFGGCNVENASYSVTLCAERCAVGSAIAAGQRNLQAIAIVTEKIASPCGACRQFLIEFNPQMIVVLADTTGRRVMHKATDLLPGFFGPADLDSKEARKGNG